MLSNYKVYNSTVFNNTFIIVAKNKHKRAIIGFFYLNYWAWIKMNRKWMIIFSCADLLTSWESLLLRVWAASSCPSKEHIWACLVWNSWVRRSLLVMAAWASSRTLWSSLCMDCSSPRTSSYFRGKKEEIMSMFHADKSWKQIVGDNDREFVILIKLILNLTVMLIILWEQE